MKVRSWIAGLAVCIYSFGLAQHSVGHNCQGLISLEDLLALHNPSSIDPGSEPAGQRIDRALHQLRTGQTIPDEQAENLASRLETAKDLVERGYDLEDAIRDEVRQMLAELVLAALAAAVCATASPLACLDLVPMLGDLFGFQIDEEEAQVIKSWVSGEPLEADRLASLNETLGRILADRVSDGALQGESADRFREFAESSWRRSANMASINAIIERLMSDEAVDCSEVENDLEAVSISAAYAPELTALLNGGSVRNEENRRCLRGLIP